MNRALTALKAICGVSIVGGVFLRLLHFGQPAKVVFDEVYFPVMANDFLHGKVDFDAHPPLGKLLIAGGIKVFGYTYFGDRIVSLLFGLGLIVLFYYLGRQYFGQLKEEGKLAGLFLATFIALECMLIVYARLGLMDGIMLFFIFLTFFHSLRAKSVSGWIMLGVLIGACASIKWLAIGILAPVAYVAWRRNRLPDLLAVLPISVIVYSGMVLLGGWIGGQKNLLQYFVWWHQSVWEYQINLKATHPWSSKWYTWPFMLRPLLMMRDTNPDGTLGIINAIGNPLIWYSSTIAMLVSLAEVGREKLVLKRPIADHPLVPLLIGWAAFILPWIPVTRVLFIYHYLPSYGFAMLMLVYWMLRVWKEKPWLIVTFFVVAAGLTLFFAPTLVGWWHITLQQLQLRVWLPSWI